MGKKDLGEPEFGLRAHSTEWWRPRAGRAVPAAEPRLVPLAAWRATRLRAIAERLRAPQASIYARLRPLAERLTNRRRSEPPACGELQTMTKRRPGDWVSAAQGPRSLSHSHVHTDQ